MHITMMMNISADVCLPRTHEIQIHSSILTSCFLHFHMSQSFPIHFLLFALPEVIAKLPLNTSIRLSRSVRVQRSTWRDSKNPWSRVWLEENYLFSYNLFYFLLLLLLCGERDNKQRTEKKKKNIKELNASV